MVLLAALLAAAALPSVAQAREPRLTIERSKLTAAVTCHGPVGRRSAPPILFAPGTGSDGSQVYALGKPAFDRLRRPVCVVAFPDRATADVQDSVQYLVHAIRRLSRKVGRPVAVAGVSQGGLLARVALTYWPSLRPRVADVVSAAATQHGSRAAGGGVCNADGCPPAIWQQAATSRFLRALNDGRDETPGRTAWTTVRSATDAVVTPQTGPAPTSALAGASNILIQTVCPGRQTSHLGTAVDSVTIAALADALAHRGPAKPARFPPDVCDHPYGSGLDEAQTTLFLQLGEQLFGQGLAGVPRVPEEPKVRPWVKRPT
jgi:triacylglycerol lipase